MNTAVSPELQPGHARINGIDFSWLECGEGPLVLLLHGFPDTALGFQAIMPDIAAAGYRAVAPYMRGYHPTGLASDNDYSMLALADDVLALLDHFSEQPARVIGHDWGAFAAVTAANMQPSRFHQLVYMCVPHLHKSKMTWAQLRKSWYVLFFQLPGLPERRVARNDFAFIDRLYRDWCPNWDFDGGETAPVKRALAAPGGLSAALAYYRSMVRGASKTQQEVMARQTPVPSMMVYGEADGSVGPDQFGEIESCFSEPLTLLALPGIGHFPQREAPEQLSRHILAFFQG